MDRFYVGAPEAHWLWTPYDREFPLCVSRRRLERCKTVGRARVPWILDSGGFSELSKGPLPARWRITPDHYAAQVASWTEDVGAPDWAAPMDMMCEPDMRRRTGLSVDAHQDWTTANYLELRQLWPRYSTRPCPFIPVLQGWQGRDYVRHREQYEAAGVDLAAAPVVGVGSVCTRPNPLSIAWIFRLFDDLRLHGFGVKTTGLELFADLLTSADSMAWSFHALHSPPYPGHPHKHCTSCREFAADWREDLRLERYGLAA